MHRSWKTVVEPLLRAAQPRVVVEIGAGDGRLTRELLAFCAEAGAVAHVIDPAPRFDADQLEREHGDRLRLHRARSLDVLGGVGEVDVALIDGDHNWHTVHGELELLAQGAARANRPYPLVVLHDVGWPYGRRDLYYDPSSIPAHARHPHALGGVRRAEGGLVTDGFNPHLVHAEHEGGARNGVLSAIEDFVRESVLELVMVTVPGWHGLAVLAPAEVARGAPVARELDRLGSSEFLVRRCAELEHDRAGLATDVARLRRERAQALARLDEEAGALRREAGARRRAEREAARLAAEHRQRTTDRKAQEARIQQLAREGRRLKLEARARKAELKRVRRWGRRTQKTLTSLRADLELASASPSWRWRNRISRAVERLLPGRRHRDPLERALRRTRKAGALPRPDIEASASTTPPTPRPPRFRPAPTLENRSNGAGPTYGGPATPTVVVPVFNGLAHLGPCLASVLEHTPEEVPILVVDDASTDPALGEWLRGAAERTPRVEILTNPANLGFTATINRGWRRAAGDVVLLNSDTEVTAGWLDGLWQVAHSRPRVATVTPLSNAAGAFSIPEVNRNAPLPDHVSMAEMGLLVRRLSDRLRPATPTGNAFCMYVRREALDTVGGFDEEAFPRGYGEENDFCQRAQAAGFVNLIDDATFVHHILGASFGPERDSLLREARLTLGQRHPDYSTAVRSFLQEDPLAGLRERMGEVLAGGRISVERSLGPRPTILFVMHAGEGGVPQTTTDLARSLSSQYRCLVLRCDQRVWRLLEHDREEAVLEEIAFTDDWRASAPVDAERLDALRRVRTEHDVALVHVRSLIGTGPEILSALTDEGVPTVFSHHDYYTVCPTIQLLDHDLRFCGGHCTPGDGDCPTSRRWIEELPALKHRYVHRWRERMAEHLSRCDVHVTTSCSARDILLEHFGFLGAGRLRVIPHGRDLEGHRPVATPPGEQRVRVVCLAAGATAKGAGLVREVLTRDLAAGRRFDVHLLGGRPTSTRQDSLGEVLHGPYRRQELPGLLAGISPSLAMVPSLWAETWSHTLTEAWMAGIPVLASDCGALAERIRAHGGGWLLDPEDADGWYRAMRRIADDPQEWAARRAEIDARPAWTVDDMARQYRALYREALAAAGPPTVAPRSG